MHYNIQERFERGSTLDKAMADMSWCLLITLLFVKSSVTHNDPYHDQPKLLTENGNLIIMAGADKNITLKTSGNGYVNLNNENLLQIATTARQAADTVVRFRQNSEGRMETRLSSLNRLVTGPQGLSARLRTLERTMSGGNGTTTPFASGTTRSSNIRINRLGTRVRTVEVQLRNLRNLLTVDECLSNPCRNGGTCQDMYNGFICNCPTNWQGKLCDEDVNECAMFAGTESGCRNGATCLNKPGSYDCVCADGWFGLHCTLRVNDCTATDSAQLCGHGICVNQGGTGRGYTCICNEGWTTDLAHSCTVDIDECQAKRYPCSHDPLVQCINLPGSYHCGFCPPGFTGNGFQCTDINECETNNGGCSLVPRVTCHNTKGSHICGQCPPGYSRDGMVCTPVAGGRCSFNNGGCYPMARCFENAGIVSCMCPDGYAGDGYGPAGCSPSAMAVHPCHARPCKNGGTCVEVGSRAVCNCHPHLTGADCSVVMYATCTPNPCVNNGTCTIQYVAGASTARCTCPQGFEGERCETVSGDCGGTFYQDSGVLQVPTGNMVQKYPNGKLCTWIIEVSSNKVVQVNFTELVMDPSENCERNYIKIHQPTATNPVNFDQRICHTGLLPKVTSVSNMVRIEMFTTTGIQENRFKLTWKAVEPACGGEFQVVTHGTIQSPGYPHNYPANQDCEWRIKGPPGKRIQVLFNNIDLEPSTDCSKDFLRLQEFENDEPSNLLAQFCNSSTPAPITTHHSAAYFIFHSDSAGSGSGFRITYTLVDGCGGVLTAGKGDISPPMGHNHRYLSEQDCEWRIQLPLGDKINIVFNSFDLEDRTDCDDYVELRDGLLATSPLVGRWCGSTVPPPYTTSGNTLTVIFHSDFVIEGDGFTLHYDTVCGGEFTARSGEIWSPNYPQPYSAERMCVYIISTPPSTAIQLHFQDFELEKLGESCDYDYLEIRDGDNANSTLVGKFCGGDAPPDVISTHNYLYITLTVDSSYQQRGFLANYSTIDLPCGGILKQTTGVFSAPQTEDGYPPSTLCHWVISAPPGWVVQLGWLSFHLEYSRDCAMDAVTIYENNTETGNSTLLDRYCGLKLPPTTVSTTNLVTVTFHSDDSVHREGFTAHYVMVDQRKVCGGTIRSVSGSIATPNYPEDYPDNKECIWIIHVPQGRQIKLRFESLDIENTSPSCAYDSLTIRNGLHETSPIVGKYCGKMTPPEVTSLTNGLWIHFSSDRSATYKGFRATWDAATTGCGGILTSPSGTLYSPNYPQGYDRFAECFFKISISQGSKVRLSIVDLDLEVHSRCILDYIEVFDGLDHRAKSLGRYCSPAHPTHIEASHEQMYIKFKSDISNSGRGFHLKYDTDCNVTLRSHHGVIESPNYPGNYESNANCMWMIQAPLGNKINISFVHLELEESSRPYAPPGTKLQDCRYDFVEILEGTQNRTPTTSLGRFCGNALPPLISSTLDQVYVHFITDNTFERTGFHLEWVVNGCGGTFRDRPTGKFTSPNYPNGYPLDVECVWKIIAPWEKSIEITISELHVEDSHLCGNDFIAIYSGEDETSPLLLKACHLQTSPIITTTSSNHAFIRFQSDISISGRGFSATYRFVDSKCGGKFTAPFGTIHSHNYPKNYDNHDDCEWLIQVQPNHLINLTFTDFDLEVSREDTTTDFVKVYDGDSINDPVLLTHSGNVLPQPAYVISTSNSLLVRHKADGSLTAKGFSAMYSLACGARISANGSGTFTLDHVVSGSHPGKEDYSPNCTWYIIAEDPADKILLTFTYFDTSPNHENTEEDCSYNYVAVHDGDDTNATTVLRQCGTKLPTPVRSSGSALTVQAVSLSSGGPLGTFEAMWSTLSTACGGELTSEQGEIASPNWPDGYPPNADCEWELKASIGNKVSLTFMKFDLEESEFCNTDYVEVRTNSSSGPLLGVFCGSELPLNITPSANSLWIRFRSDNLNTAKGFLAEYSLVHGNELAGEEGQIASPMYPRPYIQSGKFKWTIIVSNTKVVQITFSDFYMDQYGREGCYMSLQVFDGPDVTSPSLLEVCGAFLPTPVTSTSNVVTVTFNNDPWHRGSVFLLSWKAVSPETKAENTSMEENLGCGKLIHLSPANNSDIFTTPGYPKKYDSGLTCDWIVDTSPGFHIELKFTAFDLEEFEDCDADSVTLYTESSDTGGWKAISQQLCLPNTTDMVFLADRKMKIHFESDHSAEKTGFSAKVSTECGGILTGPNGVLDTSHIKGNMTTNKITCDWEIRVRSGRTIKFTFSEFDLPKLGQDSCITNFIMIRNGGYKDSPPLGQTKYCGDIVPLVPETSSNRAYISYSARPSAPGIVLQYAEVDYDCRHEIKLGTMTNFSISSPNYPQPPSTPHITCTWVVTAPPGEAVTLDFVNRFDLKYAPSCNLEYIEIHDGGSELSPLLGKWCTGTPPSQTTTRNRMYIKYFTDTDTPNNGFGAIVRIATCGGTYFDKSSVTLYSPKYPYSYLPDLSCTWRIVGSNMDTQLTFNVSELLLGEDSDNCSNGDDYIEIDNINPLFNSVDKDSPNPPPTKLCGRHLSIPNGTALIPPSSSNEVFVRFHSSSQASYANRKFAITVYAHRQRCYHEINAESGVIESPGYPNPPPRHTYLFCSWIITVPEGRRVSLKITDFDLEPKGVNYWNEFKVSFYSGGTYMSALSPDSGIPEKTIDSFGNKLRVNYYEDSISGAHRGMRAQFSSLLPDACGGKLGDSGEVSFDAVSHNYSYYFCEWTHTKNPAEADIPSTFTITITGVLNTRNSSDTTLPSYSSASDQLTVYTQTDSNPYYSLQLNEELKSPTVVRNPFMKTTITAKKRTPYQWRNKPVTPSKANLTIKFKTDPCGGMLNISDQFIQSPGYPSGYPANMDCAWLVKLQSNAQIKVEIIKLDLDMDCGKDFVRLYNGGSQSSPLLTDTLCGNSPPTTLKTQDNLLFVEFHSGPVKSSHGGFQIKVTEDFTACGGIIHLPTGSLQSPNYGTGDYPNNTECEWTVVLPPGSHAAISLKDRFNLENSTDCKNDYIQIFDWQEENWKQIGGNICGRVPPTDMKASGNKFRVLFRTNPSITGDGFKLSWQNLCGGIIHVTGNGTIVSPNYPKSYFGDLNCNYTLIAPKLRSIYGVFEDFGIEKAYEGEQCRFDNVTITTFSPANNMLSWLRSDVLSRWGQQYSNVKETTHCGSDIPEPVFSNDKLQLLFRTDKFVSFKGFLFRYSLIECGGNVTSPTTISSPERSRMLRSCTWYITAPEGKVVVVKIKKSNLGFVSCHDNGLKLYDGHNITDKSHLIQTLCGFFVPKKSRYVSSDNKMAIHYFFGEYSSLLTSLTLGFEAAIGFTLGEKQKCGGTIYTANVTLPYILQAPDVDRDGKYEPLLSCDWLILAPEAHQVRIKIDRLDVQNCTDGNNTCTCDYLEVHDGENDATTLIERFCGNTAEPNVLTSSMGSLFVHFFTDGAVQTSGFQISVTSFVSPCGVTVRNATSETQVLESPSFTGDHIQSCLWLISTPRGGGLLTVRFTSVNIPSPCTNNYVTLVEKVFLVRNFPLPEFNIGSGAESRTVGTPVRICGNRTTDITMSARSVQVKYSTNRAGPHTGFKMEFKMKKDCNSNLTTPYGRVVANSMYQFSDSCNINISQAQSNVTISLYFNTFICLSMGNANTGLKIYDGPNDQAEEVASYCTPFKRPNPVFSKGPSMYLVFNNFKNVARYDITYTTTDQGRGCGGRFNDILGSFSSPLYPAPYKKDSACRWDITVPHGSKIYFNFIFFDIGVTSTCSTNYIQLYDVDTKTGLETVHSRYCGQEKPAEVEMTGDSAIVRYFTTSHNNGTGWVLQWATHSKYDKGFSFALL
ncbi:cubilin-like isoform X2 [Macrosteles quadrilineatus]|uniref:cubilin-like isoform X2 n=1 Tax=Macrosteles quadrilineatus TaxID=74068 RepID=UPI0023E16A8A|nr:cubilin-like isoform X2 [Macrosteles quadrilineatus]